MGLAVSTSVSTVTQVAVNRTYQQAQNACTAECNQLISGNVIVLDNSQAGDITFTQRCSADASCYMSNAIEQAVTAFQTAKAEAAGAPSLFPGIQINTAVAVTDTQISNEMTQIMENLCEGEVNQNIEDNVVYATDSTVGNIGFLQEGNAFARCVMENSARLQLQMRQEGEAAASAGRGIAGLAGLIGLIIVAVIVIAIIRGVASGKKEEKKDDQKKMDGQKAPGSSTFSNRIQQSDAFKQFSRQIATRGTRK